MLLFNPVVSKTPKVGNNEVHIWILRRKHVDDVGLADDIHENRESKCARRFTDLSSRHRAHQQIVDQLVRHPNVYADTSAVRRFDYIVEAVKRAGPRKLLFGTDGPWLHPALEKYKIKLLKLSPEDEALILGGNALRLMKKRVSRRFPSDVAQVREPASTIAG